MINRNAPDTTLVGIVVSSVSIVTMYWLMRSKLKIGRELNSDAIVADAMCTKACLQLSFVLLASSLLYQAFRIGYIDVIGSLVIAFMAFREGRESFQKASSGSIACCCDDSCGDKDQGYEDNH